jgi:alanine racemase
MQRGIQFEGRPVWAEIRLSALQYNLRAIRRHVNRASRRQGARGATVQVLAVVKADAYGHGAVPVARALSAAGADWFGVTCTAEGAELRESGIREPILILTGFWPGEERRLLDYRLTPVITGSAQVRLLEKAAAKARRRKVAFHLKVETGMNRLGVSPGELPAFARTLAQCPHLYLQGIFTHFASSEIFSNEQTERQSAVFRETLESIRGWVCQRRSYTWPIARLLLCARRPGETWCGPDWCSTDTINPTTRPSARPRPTLGCRCGRRWLCVRG